LAQELPQAKIDGFYIGLVTKITPRKFLWWRWVSEDWVTIGEFPWRDEIRVLANKWKDWHEAIERAAILFEKKTSRSITVRKVRGLVQWVDDL